MLKPGLEAMARGEARWLYRLGIVCDVAYSLRFYGLIRHSVEGQPVCWGLLLEPLESIINCINSTPMLVWIRRLLVDVAFPLQILHDRLNGIHADIKPTNLMCIRQDGEFRFRLVDFGNALSVKDPDQRPKYHPNYEVQTFSYRAPELLLGMAEFGPATDIWALGVLLLELILKSLAAEQGINFGLLFEASDRTGLLLQIGDLLGPYSDQLVEDGHCDLNSPLPLRSAFEGNQLWWRQWRRANIARLFQQYRPLKNAELLGRDLSFLDMLAGLLDPDPSSRLTAQQILCHPFLRPIVPFEPPSSPKLFL